MAYTKAQLLQHRISSYLSSRRYPSHQTENFLTFCFGERFLNVWSGDEVGEECLELHDYFTKNLRIFVQCCLRNCPFQPQYLSSEHQLSLALEKKMNLQFEMFEDLLDRFQVRPDRLVSPTGRDVWMQLALLHRYEQCAIKEDIMHQAIAETLTRLGSQVKRREDRDGDDLSVYLAVYARYDATSYLQWLEQQPLVWNDLMEHFHPENHDRNQSKNPLLWDKHDAWLTRKTLVQATGADLSATVDRKLKL